MAVAVEDSVVVLVDLQTKLMPAIHDGGNVIAQAVRLATIAKLLDVPILGTEQNPAGLGENVDEVKRLCDVTIAKTHFDGCLDGLLEALPQGRRAIVVAGCEAHVCMMQTALGLLEHGCDVHIVQDAIGSRRPLDRNAALARLKDAGASLVTTEMIAFEWLRHSNHPQFRLVLSYVK